MCRRCLLLTLFSLRLAWAQDGGQALRNAILIGNTTYSHLQPLAPVTLNLKIIEAALQAAGFTVKVVENADFDNVYKGIIEKSYFSDVKPGSLCFFYYAGYALQYSEDNYLVPTDFNASRPEDINHGALSLSRVQDALEAVKARIKIIAIDASTDVGQFVTSLALHRGFAFPDRGESKEIMIGFSAAPNELALYPPNGPTPFTKYLAEAIAKPGLSIEAVFDDARRQVTKNTNGQQPYHYSNITENFYFHDPLPVPVKVQITSVKPKRNRKDRQEYVFIPAGKFFMGCVPSDNRCAEDEKPQHAVTISNGFWMGSTEVTADAYGRYLENNFDKKHRKMPDAPVGNKNWSTTNAPISSVRWEDAKKYCEWVGGRLPTEAEWEYAARAGQDNEIYPLNSENSREKANFLGTKGNDRYEFAAPVGSFDRNAYDLFDMAGNVWEWVADWYGKTYYSESSAVDPKGPASGTKHIIRGGSFDSDPSKHLRISLRKANNDWGNAVGFRCVLDDTPATKKLFE